MSYSIKVPNKFNEILEFDQMLLIDQNTLQKNRSKNATLKQVTIQEVKASS